MTEFTEISEIFSGRTGKKVHIHGWLHHKTPSGGIQFLHIRDGSGVIQSVLEKEKVDEETFRSIENLPVESVVDIRGKVIKDDRAPGGYEVSVTEIKVLDEAEEDFPIAKKHHGPAFLMENRHLWLRSRKMQTILKIRSEILKAAREWFLEHGYTEFQSPILITAACEGGSTLFKLKYFDEEAYLTQSWQLYAEAGIASVGKIFTVAPSFRAEKSRTRRHLTEYWHIEAEEPFSDLEKIIEVQEELVTYILGYVAPTLVALKKQATTWRFGRDPEDLFKMESPFERVAYDDAVEMLRKEGVPVEWGEDLTWEQQEALSVKFKKPFFITHFPTTAKPFYHRPDPNRPEVTLSADLQAPEGYGELIGGGERIHDLDQLKRRIQETNLDIEDYQWYVDLRKYGSIPHAGFGLGLERLIMWILKLEHIRDAIPFPRTKRRVYP